MSSLARRMFPHWNEREALTLFVATIAGSAAGILGAVVFFIALFIA
ncbi:hypothetical protein [Bordetella sp. LUAb4]|nr:hypothetical protein [Bordetella sp. LUAb4]